MCIISLAWQAHPHWQLVALGNRDELHERPAEPMARWQGREHLLAGRDVQAGGTWLGISEQGRFAAVTNLSGHGPADGNRASRGDLLRDFLSGEGPRADLDAVAFADFNPFNLITIADNQARVHSNRPASVSTTLPPGIHGLTNGQLDRPWPKAKHLNGALADWLEGAAEDPRLLMEALTSRTTYSLNPDASAGSPGQLEPRHSGIFIDNPLYGTRCSTIVAIDHAGQGSIWERRFDASAELLGEACLSFSWPAEEEQ